MFNYDYDYENIVEELKSAFFSDKENKKTNSESCYHNWKKYVGFTEVYYYCEYCDKKTNHDYDSAQKPWLK